MINQKPLNSEIKACLEQAKKLQTLFISENPQSISGAIRKLHEADIQLEIQRDEWSHLCTSANKTLEALKDSINQKLSSQGKIKSDLHFYNLTNKKLTMLIESLSELKKKAEKRHVTLQSPENESLKKTFELLEQYDETKFQKSNLSNPVPFQTKHQKQQTLNNLELEKIQVHLQMEKLQRDMAREKNFQLSLKERKEEVGDKLNERSKMLQNTDSPFDKLLKDVEGKLDQEFTHKIPLLEKEKDQLEEKIKNQAVCPPHEVGSSQKELHFIFLVDMSKTMEKGVKNVENCLNSLIQDRNDRDLYSLILFSDTVNIKKRGTKIDPSLKISLPKPKDSNKAFPDAMKQAYNIIDQSTSRQYAPMLIIFTDCMESHWIGPNTFNSKMLAKLCQHGKKLHSTFQKMGLFVFISCCDLESQDGLRSFALDANGGKKNLRGPHDNHDFLNNAMNSQILPQIFRDIGSSWTTMYSQIKDVETEALKYQLDVLKTSLNQKKELIDDLLKERDEVLAHKSTTLERRNVEGNKITNLYEEKKRELEQEQERSIENLDNYKERLGRYEERSVVLDKTISLLEKEIKEIAFQERISLPQSCDGKPLIINPGKIKIRESIEAFKKTKSMLLESSSDLSKNLTLLIAKIEEISKKLEVKVSSEYSKYQKDIFGRETKEEVSLGSIVGAGIKYGITSPIFPGMNETQLRREKAEKTSDFEYELLSKCSDLQRLVCRF